MTHRREFLRGASVLLGSASLGSVMNAFAAGAAANHFTGSEMRALAAIVDTIIPATDSPAASDAGTHRFIDLALPACASPAAQKTFRSGLIALGAFDELPPDVRIATLKKRAISDDALDYDQSFFKILKDYTLTGYFLSETGATRALAYDKIPGGYRGDLPLAPGQKAWTI
jgi:hypothetical protein